jgi:hypothetical protein
MLYDVWQVETDATEIASTMQQRESEQRESEHGELCRDDRSAPEGRAY